MLDDPVGQRVLEANIVASLFGLNPLVLKNLLAFGLKLSVERRVFQQIVAVRHIILVQR